MYYLFMKHKDDSTFLDIMPYNALMLLLDGGMAFCTSLDDEHDCTWTPSSSTASAPAATSERASKIKANTNELQDYNKVEISARWIWVLLRIFRMSIGGPDTRTSRLSAREFVCGGGLDRVCTLLKNDAIMSRLIGKSGDTDPTRKSDERIQSIHDVQVWQHGSCGGSDSEVHEVTENSSAIGTPANDSTDHENMTPSDGSPFSRSAPSGRVLSTTQPASPSKLLSPSWIMFKELSWRSIDPAWDADGTSADLTSAGVCEYANVVMSEAASLLHAVVLHSRVACNDLCAAKSLNIFADMLMAASPRGPATPWGLPEVVETIVSTLEYLATYTNQIEYMQSIQRNKIILALAVCVLHPRGVDVLESPAKLLRKLLHMDGRTDRHADEHRNGEVGNAQVLQFQGSRDVQPDATASSSLHTNGPCESELSAQSKELFCEDLKISISAARALVTKLNAELSERSDSSMMGESSRVCDIEEQIALKEEVLSILFT
jgi:hypothetical protein